jgi:CHAT domain-containing protein
LPFTEEEVNQISGLFSKNKDLFFKYFIRKQAIEKSFKSAEVENADILHLATHGLVNKEKPGLSGLLFHPENPDTTEDGILYTGEIYNLNLKADLVTLSAYETALGKQKQGEGMLGLTRSFTYAGAKNLVVSLWQVNDKATSDLMIAFYNLLLSGHSKAESLRKAKEKLMKNPETANPYFWAPFILVEG